MLGQSSPPRCFLIELPVAAAQLTSLRVGTNSPASTEAVLFSSAKDAAILSRTNWTLK
jgi:hypothetical protein